MLNKKKALEIIASLPDDASFNEILEALEKTVVEMDKIECEKKIEQKVQQYLEDPNTKVIIDHNTDTGEVLYSVAIVDSVEGVLDGFWLASFKTEAKAKSYVKKHKLNLVSK